MQEVECWRVVAEKEENDCQARVDDVNVETPSPAFCWLEEANALEDFFDGLT